MAKTPAIVRNFNLFVNGTNFAGLVDEVTLPQFKLVIDEHRAGGMDSPIAVDMGMERMELKFSMAEHNAGVLRQFGVLSGNAVMLLFRGARVADEVVSPYLITARGMYTEVSPAAMKVGEKAMMEAVLSCRYFKLEIGQETLMEIDVDNMIRIVDGVDHLQQIREIIDA